MLDVIAASSTPFRPSGLALLLKERTKRETLQIYLGNLQWSILAGIHSLGGSDLQLLSYSELWDAVYQQSEDKKTRAKREAEQVRNATANMIAHFLKGGKKNETV